MTGRQTALPITVAVIYEPVHMHLVTRRPTVDRFSVSADETFCRADRPDTSVRFLSGDKLASVNSALAGIKMNIFETFRHSSVPLKFEHRAFQSLTNTRTVSFVVNSGRITPTIDVIDASTKCSFSHSLSLSSCLSLSVCVCVCPSLPL